MIEIKKHGFINNICLFQIFHSGEVCTLEGIQRYYGSAICDRCREMENDETLIIEVREIK